jgi:GNAT superfamily N-acetyltransferase
MEAVRPATEDDLPRLVELARAGIEELRPMKGGSLWVRREARDEPVEDGLKMALADGDSRVVVGTIDGFPVGYGVAHSEELHDGSLLGVVDDIFVEEGARQVGVGEAMMGDLVAWCEERGCVGMDALALPGHRSTKNFFEESGFTARALIMHHRMEEPEA